jgi:uncharacterized protein YraI
MAAAAVAALLLALPHAAGGAGARVLLAQAAPSFEHVVTLRDSNVRSAPSSAAPVVRVVAAGTALRVHGRTRFGDWVQVGAAEPWGWIFTDLLEPVPPPTAN